MIQLKQLLEHTKKCPQTFGPACRPPLCCLQTLKRAEPRLEWWSLSSRERSRVSVCIRVLLQSKWPLGKASMVIAVNFSVKLRTQLRDEPSERSAAPLQRWANVTDPGRLQQHVQASWLTNVCYPRRNRKQAYTCVPQAHYLTSPFTSSTCGWELPLSEGRSGSAGGLETRGKYKDAGKDCVLNQVFCLCYWKKT